MKQDPPHFVSPSEDCMGSPTPGYWRQFLTCSDGHTVLGIDQTPERATARAMEALAVHEDFLKLPPETRLKFFAAGDLCNRDMKECIKLLVQLLVK
jgi:hypothetical protein